VLDAFGLADDGLRAASFRASSEGGRTALRSLPVPVGQARRAIIRDCSSSKARSSCRHAAAIATGTDLQR
jgi:hypothetical protein